MNLSTLNIRDSYPFDYAQLAPYEQKIFEALPPDYQGFLKQYNGGFVEGDKALFKNHLVWQMKDKVNRDTSSMFEEFWGFISYKNQEKEEGKPASVLHQHFDRHLDEMFLPNGILVIGYAAQSCLIAISLNQSDYGSIYYWEWYWQYPWYESFFNARIEQAQAGFAGQDLNKILGDEHMPLIYDPPQSVFYLVETPEQKRYMEAHDALNYATLVKVADSFTEFVEGFYVGKDDA